MPMPGCTLIKSIRLSLMKTHLGLDEKLLLKKNDSNLVVKCSRAVTSVTRCWYKK